MPHVAFLHERFLFRFGHDRTMLLHGRELARRGWRVSYVGFALDREVIEAVGGHAVLLPSGAPSYAELDRWGCALLRDRWFELFAEGAPDVVVNGGWPFYAFNRQAEALGAAAVVFDAGATPLEDAPEAQRPVHEKLRALRRAHMGQARRTVSVSGFIARSQTLPDAPAVPNVVVPNGADHIFEPLWGGEAAGDARVGEALAEARRGGRRAVVHLGRWEDGYKNRAGALEVLRRLRARHDAALLVLAEGDPELPPDLAPHVVFAGHPGDEGLRALMAGSDAGFSASLWEGFNLPLAEMLLLGRPAYALDLAAHPEVAIDPAFLRADAAGLANGLSEALSGPVAALSPARLAAYRERMAWSRAAGALEAVLLDALDEARASTPVQVLAMDVTNASRDPANSGVVRVTRQLARAVQPYARLLPVCWDEAQGGYRTLGREERAKVSGYGGPDLSEDADEAPAPLGAALARRGFALSHTAWLNPETVLYPRAPAVAAFFARERLPYAAVLHDLIPATHPQVCAPEIVDAWPAYADYLRGARRLLANSQTTAQAWREAEGEGGPDLRPELAVELLPGDLGPRGAPKPEGVPDPVRILTVSTFEPRKNHAGLLEAFRRARAMAGDRRLELHLVGGGYAGDGGVGAQVREAAQADPAIVLHGRVDDAELSRLYEAADFTVYPSLWEGFGLPVVESAHRARPYVCSDAGSTGELAAALGAGLACDVADPDALAAAIARLATDDALRARLARIAAITPWRTWPDYALSCLRQATRGRPSRVAAPAGPAPRPPRQLGAFGDPMDWDSLLYPDKPVGVWQMTDAERMALTGLLARRRPRTYLEIGTYHGGSALLASEFADWVVTVDIDPEAGDRFARPDNVTFMAGRSQEVVPPLLQDLLARDLYPEMVLIDGDHSAEGVRRDIEMFLRIRPPHPLLVVFHDSFNPVCRSGIRTAPWADCPYVARLDVDFVPGRLVENPEDPFAGQLWGGLAVAVLTPEPQPNPVLTATADPAFQRTMAQVARRAA